LLDAQALLGPQHLVAVDGVGQRGQLGGQLADRGPDGAELGLAGRLLGLGDVTLRDVE
jgi:hypothetical protein